MYVENHPRVIYCDVNNMIPGDSYRVHDLKLDLPDGIELVHDEKIPDDNTVIFEFEIGIRSEIIRLTEES